MNSKSKYSAVHISLEEGGWLMVSKHHDDTLNIVHKYHLFVAMSIFSYVHYDMNK